MGFWLSAELSFPLPAPCSLKDKLAQRRVRIYSCETGTKTRPLHRVTLQWQCKRTQPLFPQIQDLSSSAQCSIPSRGIMALFFNQAQ